MILISLLISILIWGDIQNKYLWVIVATMICFGFIGGIDDYLKIIKSNHKGLSAGKKYYFKFFLFDNFFVYIFYYFYHRGNSINCSFLKILIMI